MKMKALVKKNAIVLCMSMFGLAATAVYAGSGESPSMELLEFLGEWQTEDGEFLDPISLLEVEQQDVAGENEDQSNE